MLPLPPGPRRSFGRRFALRSLLARPLDFITEMAARYGDLVYFGSWRTPVVFLNHPQLAREVLVSRADEFARVDAIRRTLRIFDGESLLVTEGDQWRQQRRLLQQGFRSERLRGYACNAVEHTREMLRRWPSLGTINVCDEMSTLCMRILCQMLFGIQPSSEVAASIRAVLDARQIETSNAVASGRRPQIGSRRNRQRALARVHRFLDGLIERQATDGDDRGDLLGMLVRAGRPEAASEGSREEASRQIRDDIISMINASLDATAAAMSWTLSLVARHADVQMRLRDEIERSGAGPTDMAAGYVKLPLAERVFNESLRLYPPNWLLIMRRSIQRSTLGGFRIPRGSWLFMFPYVMHRDARWFATPESFQPDRFRPERLGPAQKLAYMPFGLGPHVCIGKALSTILATSVLASILAEFRLEPMSDQDAVEPSVDIVMKPEDGLRLIAKRYGADLDGTPDR